MKKKLKKIMFWADLVFIGLLLVSGIFQILYGCICGDHTDIIDGKLTIVLMIVFTTGSRITVLRDTVLIRDENEELLKKLTERIDAMVKGES